jgi:predicted ester cyclase
MNMKNPICFFAVPALAISISMAAAPAPAPAATPAAPTTAASGKVNLDPQSATMQAAATSATTGSATRGSIESNKAAYRAVIEEFVNKGNAAIADRHIAKDIVDHDPANMAGGLEGFKTFVSSWRTAFPDSRMEVESIIGEGDRIMARLRATGTHSGTFNGIAPTNRKINVQSFDEVLFKNGKVVEHWAVSDQMTLMKQLGVQPAGTQQAQPSSAPAPAAPASGKVSPPGSNKY